MKYFFAYTIVDTKTFELNYWKLNPEQQDAVNTLDGPVMVIAWPGTGKTQIIGMRTANIILKSWVHPENIMITTFTEAWVIAIRERLISMIWSDAYKVYVSTVHSFAQDVIKSFPEKFTVEKLDTPIDDIESLELISDIVGSLLSEQKLQYLMSYGDPLFYVRAIKNALNNLKREWVSVTKFKLKIKEETEKSLAWLEEKRNNKRIKKIEKYEAEHEQKIGKLTELATIFEIYNAKLRDQHLYDFNDMINFVLEKFREDDELRTYYAEVYQYIMLDEYQDTNNPQNEIVDLILSVSETPNIMVVGDDDQSIYRFQGANIENMLEFTTKYQNSKIIILDKNYRSQQWILNAAENLIENNSERLINKIPGLSKKLDSQTWWVREVPSICITKDDIDEKLSVVERVLSLLRSWIQASEIAIIVRSNKEVITYGDILKEHEIAVTSKLESNILESDYVKSIFTFFKVLSDPYSYETDFLNLLRSSLIDIDGMDILKINTYLYRQNYSKRGHTKLKLFDVLSDSAALQFIWVQWGHKIHEFISKYVEAQEQFSRRNFILALSWFLSEFKILDTVQSQWNFQDLQDVYSLFHTIKSWAWINNNISLRSIINKYELYFKYGYRINRTTSLWDDSWVQVLTAHSSKWLEYEYVFIPGLYTWNWDTKSNRELIPLPSGIAWNGFQATQEDILSDAELKNHNKERQMQEDRRLFFVALTRAKKQLYLSFPSSILWSVKLISPFLWEIWDSIAVDFVSTQDEKSNEMIQEMLQESKLIKHNNEEINFIQEFFLRYKLSVSDLNTFLISPKDFLYRSVFKYPFEENENSIFGTMYHRTLELFYKKIQDTWEVQEYEYLEYVFLRQLEKEYLTFEEFQRLKSRWLESLKWYYETYNGTFVAPLKTEYKFSRKNIFFETIPLTWIIDKIELLSEDFTGNDSWSALFSQNIKLTDYKTWSVKYIWEIKWVNKDWKKDEWFERGRYWRQLMFYKLLFENDSELSSQYNLCELELDFCEWKKWNYKRVSVEVNEDEYAEFKSLIKETYSKMIDIGFWKDFLNLK